jgi:hypothetical protein
MSITREDVATLRENDPRTPLVSPHEATKVVNHDIGSAARLPFVSAGDLLASIPAEPDWTLQGYLAPGSLTLLAAKPKAGKSTLAFAVSEALVSGATSFLGRTAQPVPVVYVSEESAGTLAHKLPKLADLRVLTRDAIWPKPSWAELVAGSVAEAKAVGAVLLVVDTFAYWAAMPRDAEKDAGAAQAAMQPLLDAAQGDLAVLVPLHQRKGGGDDGEGIRGSGAIAGIADVLLELERTQRPRERVLLALSRYPSTPGSLVITHDPATGAWSAIAEGERADARSVSDRLAILGALKDATLTRAELEDVVGAPGRQWHGTLEDLVNGGQVERSGRGVKGDPLRFSIVRSDSARSPAQKARSNDSYSAHPDRGAETNLSAPTNNERQHTLESLVAAVNARSISDEDAEREWARLEAAQA